MPARATRLHVLLVTPIVPAPTGNGLAMRAAIALDGLAGGHDVTLAVVPVAGGAHHDDRWARERASAVHRLEPVVGRAATTSWLTHVAGRAVAHDGPLPARAHGAPPALGEHLAAVLTDPPDLVLAVRAYTAGVALPFADAGVPTILDADEDDAATLRSIAALHDRRGEPVEARATRADADAHERFARHVLPRVAVVTAAGPAAGVVHVANAVDVSRWTHARVDRLASAGPVELLLVGNHDYVPNRDAAEQLVQRIVPAVAARVGRNVRARIVGPIDPPLARRLRGAGAVVDGRVPDVAPCYRAATAAVVPLRAGGGTRVKILEAFAAGCPVVATPTAVAGLDVRDGHHATIARRDDAEAVVDAVVRHLQDAPVADQVAAARAHVEAEHDARAVGRRWAALAREVATGREPR